METKVITCIGRFSWCFLAAPQKGKNTTDKAKYSTDFLMRDEDVRKVNPKTNKTYLQEMQEAIVAAWNDKMPKAKEIKDIKNWVKIKSTLKYNDKDDETLPDYARGTWRIAGKNEQKPGVVDAGNQPMDADAIAKIKAGDWGKILLNAYCYDVDGSVGVAFSLRGAQWIKSGEPFAPKTDLSKEFDVEEISPDDAAAAFE